MTVAPQLVGPSTSSGGPDPSPDVDELLADIGDRIRAERQARGWSQTELGRRAGIGLATVKRMENGSVWMRPLLRTCWALNVQVDYLMSDRWKMPCNRQLPEQAPKSGMRPALSPQQAKVLREAAGGGSLAQVGARIGMGRQAVGAALSKVYQRLGVAHLPQDERRAAAMQVAMRHGLFEPTKRTS